MNLLPLCRPFETVLIANRGEIALRIIRTARALGYRTVAVYSEADAAMPHVAAADCAVCIGPPPAAESYLNIAALIEAARRTGADAVHPGYGFLSENPAFAEACQAAGLVFIGPPAPAIAAMADKARAKQIMQAAGVPCVPGYEGDDQTPSTLAREAAAIGYPVMIKAVAGGGGKGMRLVSDAGDFEAALASARSEAAKAFGRGDVLLEKAIVAPRHVEVQIFADAGGRVVHLGDRDCSIQRRHQKVIEEAPAPGLDDALRVRMGDAAVAAARAVGYVNAGTVEFLVDRHGAFYFLEMNTRLQVEHGVTEMVTGLDLVAWQLRVAAGEALPLTQDGITITGHAIEARLYAEDPAADFLPQSGTLLAWGPPEGAGIRVDHALRPGLTVSTFYDPMIAKVIGHGDDRAEATRRLSRGLERLMIAGFPTNRIFLLACLAHAAFRDGALGTDFIDRTMQGWSPPFGPDVVAVAAAWLYARQAAHLPEDLRGWRSAPWDAETMTLACGTWIGRVGIVARSHDTYAVTVDGTAIVVTVPETGETSPAAGGRIVVDGVTRQIGAVWSEPDLYLSYRQVDTTAREEALGRSDAAAVGRATVRAPMPGIIIAVMAARDQRVEKGDTLLVLGAMKMELRITAPLGGTVTALHVATGDQVPIRQALAEIQAD